MPGPQSVIDAFLADEWLDLPRTLSRARDVPEIRGRAGRLARSLARRTPSATGYLGAAGGRKEAFVKVIRNGGTSTAGQLRTQVGYLTRDGRAEMERDGFGPDIKMSADEVRDEIDAWSRRFKGNIPTGHTMHLLVSYPKGTDPEAAYNAARDFAYDAFRSGDLGDQWEYMTAFHTDKDHPHLHIILQRRGLENGKLLRVSPYGPITPDRLRELQVETAKTHGIELTATPRVARGHKDRGPTTTEYRRAREAGRAAPGRAHKRESAEVFDRASRYHARRFRDLARTNWTGKTETASATLHDAADALERGGVVAGDTEERRTGFRLANFERKVEREKNPLKRMGLARQLKGFKRRAEADYPALKDLEPYREALAKKDQAGDVTKQDVEALETVRQDLSEKLARFDAQAASVKDPTARANNDRKQGKNRGRVAALFPERTDYQAHRKRVDDPNLYRAPAGHESDKSASPPGDMDTREEKVRALAYKLIGDENKIARIKDPERRAKAIRQLDHLKERAFKVYVELIDLAPYREELERKPRLEAADRDVKERAKDLGIDATTFLARYKSGDGAEPIDAGTAARWLDDEVSQVLRDRGVDPASATEGAREFVWREVVDLHTFAATRWGRERDRARKAERERDGRGRSRDDGYGLF